MCRFQGLSSDYPGQETSSSGDRNGSCTSISSSNVKIISSNNSSKCSSSNNISSMISSNSSIAANNSVSPRRHSSSGNNRRNSSSGKTFSQISTWDQLNIFYSNSINMISISIIILVRMIE